MLTRAISLSLVFVITLVGCSSHDPELCQTIRSVSASTPSNVRLENIYADRTSAVMGLIPGGVVGGLVGVGIKAAGTARFKPATEPNRPYVAGIVRAQAERALKMYGKAGSGATGNLRIDDINFGVRHDNDQRFQAIMSAKGEVRTSSGAVAMSRFFISASQSTFTKDEATRNPVIYRRALEEAARNLAIQVVMTAWPTASARYSGEDRPAAEPADSRFSRASRFGDDQ